jgi:hypothetical protein
MTTLLSSLNLPAPFELPQIKEQLVRFAPLLVLFGLIFTIWMLASTGTHSHSCPIPH